MNMKAIFAASIIAVSAFVPKIVVAADYNPQNSEQELAAALESCKKDPTCYQKSEPLHAGMQFKGNLKKFLAEYEQNFGIKPEKELVAALKSCVKDPRCYKGE